MTGDAFDPPAADPSSRPDAGTPLPSFGELLNETIEHMTEDIGPYALAGLSYLGGTMVVSLVAIFALYACGGATVGASMILAATVGGDAGGALAFLGMILGLFVSFAVFIGILIPLVMPMHASLERATQAHIRGDVPLSLAAPFSTITVNVGSVLLVAVAASMAGFAGIFVFYIGAFIAAWLLFWAPTLVSLDDQRPAAALSRSVKTAVYGPPGVGLLSLGVFLLAAIAANIPVLGPVFAVALKVRTHDAIFAGDNAITGEGAP